MTSISQKYAERNGKPLFICDFSPPRGADLSTVQQVKDAGADFFLTQAFYEVGRAKQFLVHYRRLAGQKFPKPVFYGLQILEKDGLVFGDVPEATRSDLERGRPGTEIAIEQL